MPHNGPEPASKIQVSHKLLCTSPKEEKGGEKKFLILILKRRNIFFHDGNFFICYLCLLLPGKENCREIFY